VSERSDLFQLGSSSEFIICHCQFLYEKLIAQSIIKPSLSIVKYVYKHQEFIENQTKLELHITKSE